MTGIRPDPLDPELLAKARLKIAEARKQGFKDAEIDAYLKSEIGAGLDVVARPTDRDFWGLVGSGVTLGHLDEIEGLVAKLAGGDYRHGRDAAREELAGFRATRPKTAFATELVAGGVPATLTAPIFGPGGWIRNALKAGAVGGGMGTVAGAGHSEGETAGEIAKDAAVSGGISAVLGGLLSAGASGVGAAGRRVADAMKPARPIVREAATQLPKNAAATVARQEVMAPGSAALADLSPEMQALVRGVGADAKTGVSARVAAEDRLGLMENAVKSIRARYEAMNQPLAVDDKLKGILTEAGRSHVLKKGAAEIDFTALQRIRTALRAEARATKNSAVRHDKNAAVKQITEWLEGHMPDLKQVDSDFAFLSDRINAAKKTLREVTASSKNYAASRAYGSDAGSIGGSLPQGSRGVMDVVASLLRPDRAGRARAANELLLTPGDATSVALGRIGKARAGMDAPQGELSPALRSLLFGDITPTAPGLLMSP